MTAVLKTLTLLLFAAGTLYLHEQLAQTWAPMFRLILISLALAAVVTYLIFRWAGRFPPGKKAALFNCLAVFCFVALWVILWAVAEEGLIRYNLATQGHDDTGGRYFYPGHSGMGYADGLSNPIKLLWKMGTFGIPGAIILGLPMGLGFRSELFRWRSL